MNGNVNRWKKIPYASVVGSLMYAQTCTKPNISFVVSMLGNGSLESCEESDEVLKGNKRIYAYF